MPKIPKVVFRFSKLKDAGKINAALSHNARRRITLNANPNPDAENILIKTCVDAHRAVIETIGEQTIRKNAVLCMEIIISASPEYFRPTAPERFGYWEEDKLQAWREAIEPWIAEKFPQAVSVILHLDEATPHYQILDVPLDEKGKLNARGKYGGDSQLDTKRWQDWAAEPVKHLGIIRGIDGSAAKHERIKDYYARVNAEMPKIAPLPKPVPPSPLQRVFDENLIQYAKDERKLAQESFRPIYYALADKANGADLAIKQKNEAIATADKLSSEKALLKKSADLLRELPLDEVLTKVYGANLDQDSKPGDSSRKWILGDGREIAISLGNTGADVWMEQGSKNQRGAINLVMHLDGVDYKDAIRLLAEHFDSAAVTAEYTAQLSRQAQSEVKAIIQQPLKPPTSVPENWQRVKNYLTGIPAIPAKLVDWMYKQSKIYADRHNNAVFPREKGGAYLQGISNKPFWRSLGNKEQGAYIIEGTGDVWLCVSPIDATSIKAHSPDVHIIALGANMLKLTDVTIPSGRKVCLAFDIDAQGRKFTDEAIKLWPTAEIIKPPSGKNWSEALQNDSRLIDGRWLSDDGAGKTATDSKIFIL